MVKDVEAQFELTDLMAIVMTLGVAGIGLIYMLQVQEDVKSDINATASPEAYAAAGKVVTGTGKFGTKFGLIVTVVIAALIIGVLIRYLWVRFS